MRWGCLAGSVLQHLYIYWLMWRGCISVSSATWTIPRIKCSIKILNSLQTIRNFFPGLVSGGLVSTQKVDFWWKQRRHLCNFSIVGSIPQQIPALSFYFYFSFFKILFLFQTCLSPSFPPHTGEAHEVCRDVACCKPLQPSWLQNNNNNKNKT